jgi:uncharacterized protein YhfF
MDYKAFIKANGLNPKKFNGAFAFENDTEIIDKEAANYNAYLVKQGLKTATICPVEDFEKDAIRVDDTYQIVLDGEGQAVAAIQYTRATIEKFSDVTESFAKRDGESETLEHWQGLVRSFLAEYGGFDEDMEIYCIEFRRIA